MLAEETVVFETNFVEQMESFSSCQEEVPARKNGSAVLNLLSFEIGRWSSSLNNDYGIKQKQDGFVLLYFSIIRYK